MDRGDVFIRKKIPYNLRIFVDYYSNRIIHVSATFIWKRIRDEIHCDFFSTVLKISETYSTRHKMYTVSFSPVGIYHMNLYKISRFGAYFTNNICGLSIW